jgi:hypothetical protein
VVRAVGVRVAVREVEGTVEQEMAAETVETSTEVGTSTEVEMAAEVEMSAEVETGAVEWVVARAAPSKRILSCTVGGEL